MHEYAVFSDGRKSLRKSLLRKEKATPVGMAFLGNPHECRLG